MDKEIVVHIHNEILSESESCSVVSDSLSTLTRWTQLWVNSRSWWWTGRPGVLQLMGSQRVRHSWATELNWLNISYIYHSFFIQSSVNGHLGCFHALAIVNSTSMNNRIHVSLSILVSSGYMPRVGLLDHMVVLFLVFKGISIPPSIMAVSIYNPNNGARVLPFLHTLSSIYCL